MIAGLSVESWLLLILAVGIGLGIEIFFFISQRKVRRQRPQHSGEAGIEP